jgi:hypothetical protein
MKEAFCFIADALVVSAGDVTDLRNYVLGKRIQPIHRVGTFVKHNIL